MARWVLCSFVADIIFMALVIRRMFRKLEIRLLYSRM
jgi:hypothetical protein